MADVKYIMRVLSGVKFKKMRNVIDRIHQKTGKNKVFLFFDILNCAVRYGAGYYDYLIFAFYDMNHAQRETYLTRMKNKKVIAQINDPAYSEIFNQKNLFNERFRKYIRRDFVDVAEMDMDAFRTFMEGKESVFAKPNSSESGKGIEKLSRADFAGLEEMYAYVKDESKHFGVLEELIVQHEDMAKLYPLSVNTIRIGTLVAGGQAYCAYATCKMGNEGKFVDNMENSGLACPIDLETERICGVAHTSALINYDTHPYTGVKLVGYKIPYAREAVELCKRAAMEVPQMQYIGWDVCIMPDGPAIVEGNNFPGYDFARLPEHTPDKIGLVPFFKEHLPDLKV